MKSNKNNFLAAAIAVSVLGVTPAFAGEHEEHGGGGHGEARNAAHAVQHQEEHQDHHGMEGHGGGAPAMHEHEAQVHNEQQAVHNQAHINQEQMNHDHHHGGNVVNNNVVSTGGNWQQERQHYHDHWNKISRERQHELDAQMRAQWLAYHHNHWDGAYNWDEYSDPGFLDYLHSSNPGLLGTLRNIIGI